MINKYIQEEKLPQQAENDASIYPVWTASLCLSDIESEHFALQLVSFYRIRAILPRTAHFVEQRIMPFRRAKSYAATSWLFKRSPKPIFWQNNPPAKMGTA
ncbi:hypothetical protein LSG25_01810 [Paralcaligenes sp. KSB-10]|uniref:hypothetical protein n=1 Tax=Paralcaligenes sp. KSB-10 TaxID=2901142 RepID=UPI001E63D24B|nr:hypothetical protein [Paralcaligenes sp. KSB-10]UHL64668.1 hypothetical protein LSG25_01810 [Paralcaligenes sp. KSB-10]